MDDVASAQMHDKMEMMLYRILSTGRNTSGGFRELTTLSFPNRIGYLLDMLCGITPHFIVYQLIPLTNSKLIVASAIFYIANAGKRAWMLIIGCLFVAFKEILCVSQHYGINSFVWGRK